jgi:hypothetical protein
MAYVSKETKARVVAAVKPILAKYGVKGTFAVRNGMSLVLNLKSGKVDFPAECLLENLHNRGHINVNTYHFDSHFIGISKRFFAEVIPAMKSADWYDNSDPQTDYFSTAYYIDINVGKWDAPYTVTN